MPEVRVQQHVEQALTPPARYHEGGQGEPLLLLHGGWGGAQLHWSRVWDRLAGHFRVIAPDLPGLGWLEEPPCRSVSDYVTWLVALLDALGVERVLCVGNSFGATLAWSFAGRVPERCGGLVLVDGFPMPRTPAPLLWLGRRPRGEALLRRLFLRLSYTPHALERAFADVRNVPPELRRNLTEHAHELVAHFTPIIVAGDGPPPPKQVPLLLWGAQDRLRESTLHVARRVHASLPGSTLRVIPGAGHFPQLEAPDTFVEALLGWANAGVG